MGTRQTKGSVAERASPGAAPGPRRERPDFWASLLLRAGDKAGRAGSGAGLPPYHRRVGMVQELLRMVRQGRREEAGTLLQHLRQDLGMESTSLDDVLYRYASFRNLVDPITHDLVISLARYIHCPKPEGDALGAMEKLCRQLTYHLSPHSQWRPQRGLGKRKPQAWFTGLQGQTNIFPHDARCHSRVIACHSSSQLVLPTREAPCSPHMTTILQPQLAPEHPPEPTPPPLRIPGKGMDPRGDESPPNSSRRHTCQERD
nr:leucine-rich repeat-containing protein 75A [Camelus dromedarius]